jgi:hypothetical protein
MKHASIRQVFGYWNERRGVRLAPDRGDIEPAAIRHALADTFILAADPSTGLSFRIAGTRVCALFGRELKGVPFADLWTPENRAAIRALLGIVTGESVGIVAGGSGPGAEGDALHFELLLLPLRHRGGTEARILGAFVPEEAPGWLGAATLGRLTLGTVRYLGPQAEAAGGSPLVATAPLRRLRRGLVVYDGGNSRAAGSS